MRSAKRPKPSPDLVLERVPVGSIVLDPANVRRHPKRNLEVIRGSLARFGQQRALIVDQDNVVRAGNGTLLAARSLDWKEIWIQRTRLTGAELAAYALADNRIAELSEWDAPALADSLELLTDTAVLGWSAEEVKSLVKSLGSGSAGETVEPRANVEQLPADEYLARGTRTVVLVFAADEYDRMTAALADYSEKHDLEAGNSTAAVVHLVKEAGYAVDDSEISESAA